MQHEYIACLRKNTSPILAYWRRQKRGVSKQIYVGLHAVSETQENGTTFWRAIPDLTRDEVTSFWAVRPDVGTVRCSGRNVSFARTLAKRCYDVYPPRDRELRGLDRLDGAIPIT